MSDTRPLAHKPRVGFDKLLQAIGGRSTDPDILSSLASRLLRLDKGLGPADRAALARVAGGRTVREIAVGLVDALDPDRHVEAARAAAGLPPDAEPTAEQIAQAAEALRREAAMPLMINPTLRRELVEIQGRFEQTIDTVSTDEVLEAGYSADAAEKARSLVASFEAFLAEHRDEITALQVLYSRPYARRLRLEEVKALAEALRRPLHLPGTDPDATLGPLWHAYEALERSRVRGASGARLWTDIMALVRYALHQDDELAPFRERVEARFAAWLAGQEVAGRCFTDEQRAWLELIRDHIAANLAIEPEDFNYAPFTQRGGLGKVCRLFGDDFERIIDELNEVLAA